MEYKAPESKILMTHRSQCKDKRDLIYGVLGLIKHPERRFTIDYACSMEELICSALSCYKGLEPLHYYEKRIARLSIEAVQCFTYAKRVVGRQLAGDAGRLLALPAFGIGYNMIFPITNINDQTADPRHVDRRYVDPELEMFLASTWEAKDGRYRQYHAMTEARRHSEAGRSDNALSIWTKVKVRSGDFCRRGYSRSYDHRWNLLVFERYTTGSKEDHTMLGFGIEMLQKWAATDFQQAGGGMATFFDDDYPYFEGERSGLFIWKHWGANNPESSYEGSIGSFSIFELLKMASFVNVFNAVHWQVVPGHPRYKS